MRGRKPLPKALRLLTGNAGHRELPSEPELPEPATDEMAPPADLKGEGRREWVRLAEPLRKAGVLKASDLSQFETYCRLHGETDEVERLIRKTGYASAKKLGYVNDLFKLRKQKRDYAAELGLTPSARTRVKADPIADGKDQTEEMLFGRRGG